MKNDEHKEQERKRELTAKEQIIAIARKAGYGVDDRKDKIVIYL